MKYLMLAALVVVLSACASPPKITNTTPEVAVAHDLAPAGSTVAVGLQNAAWNLDQAISIGVLPADDPAALCAHQALQRAGLEPMPGGTTVAAQQSFTPKVTDAISAGSVLYIQSKQVQSAPAGLELSAGCKGVIGDIVVQGLAAFASGAASLVPGAGLLNSVRLR